MFRLKYRKPSSGEIKVPENYHVNYIKTKKFNKSGLSYEKRKSAISVT